MVLSWCKSNFGFVLLNFAIWYWNTFLKCDYVLHHFNVHFFMFFANELSLAVYFICILDCGNDVRQSKFKQFSYLSSKWIHKAAETTCNISNSFGPKTANEHAVQRWVKKFCKGEESLEDEECGGRPLKVDKDQLRGSSKLILLKLHQKLPKNSKLTILQFFSIWSKLKR